ncbi:molybdenum cofactor guanylyltransferase [Algoriphagus aestuariicola]
MLKFSKAVENLNPTRAAYILCGGKSSRMGEEKGLVAFQGKPFVQWILEAVFVLQGDPVLVTGNLAYADFGVEMIADRIVDKGPVGGIYTALNHCQTTQALILSCDIPKIDSDTLEFLIVEAQKHPGKITFLSDGKNDYPLIGVYPKSCLPAFGEAIEKDELKLRRLVESLPHNRIVIHPESVSNLQNINTKSELITLSNLY